MDSSILNPEIQEFINSKVGFSVSKLALQKNPFPEMDWVSILNQIEAKTKAETKLPTWFTTKNIIYPSKISVEQTSSEKTAVYKSTLVSGHNLIDLTGGFGIDDYYFAKQFEKVVHCEINPVLSTIVKHNYEQLNSSNISCETGDSLEIITRLNQKWDWIYIDPSRRNDAKGKVFMLQDCLPNVPENLDLLFDYSNSILIKTAPLLDISAGLSELRNVKSIHIIALDNEVKELLWELQKDYLGSICIQTANISKSETIGFEFVLGENVAFPNYDLPKNYLYEPNSAIMKSGGFDEVGLHYNLSKLHKNSHLYSSSELISFPGRIFEIVNSFSYHKSEMKRYLEGTKINITTRNFPDSVESIRKKWKIKEGGNQYCFFTTDVNDNKIVLICRKL